MPGKDRQRQLAREKLQRQMAKRAEAARRRRRGQAISGGVLAVVAVIALSAFGVSKIHHTKKAAKPTASRALCAYTKPPGKGAAARKANLPSLTGSKKGKVTVDLTTSQGELSLSLDRGRAPCTVNSFVSLVEQKYFDKTPCHRLVTSGIFVLQCGDPSGSGNGGPGYQFGEEGLPPNTGATITYPAGTVAMANAGPGTNGSQFFIVYQDSKFPPSYTIFGSVTKGLDKVVAIGKTGAVDPSGKPAGDGKPKTPVLIMQAKIA